jgi:GNAT superfamily N-acetyltransferase
MADWQIERLDKSHQRSGFSCGKVPLDEFIVRLVTQYEKRHLGRTYVAVERGESQVLGYYTLASSAIPFLNLPESATKKLPRHPVPVILLARLAVDQRARGRGLGETLLLHALGQCVGLADQLGVHAIEVDAIDEQARSFYEKYGFEALLDADLHLFLPIATIGDLLRRR